MKRLLLRIFITPDRVRRAIALCVSWLMTWCRFHQAWDVVGALPRYLRGIADVIDVWNATELPADADARIERIVGDTISSDQIGGLVEMITSLSTDAAGGGDAGEV